MLDQLAWVTPPYFLLIELYQLAFYGAVWLIEISAKLIYTAICCRRQYTNYAYSLLFVCTLALFAWLVPTDYSYDAWHILWKLILHCDKARSTHTLRHAPPPTLFPHVWVEYVVFVFVFILIFNSHCWPTFSVCVGEALVFFLYYCWFLGHRFLEKIRRKQPGAIIYSFTARKLINLRSHNF